MTPEYILKMLRGRRGLEQDDKSQDDSIKKMDPMNKLRECLGWKLGDPSWADTILRMAKDCEVIDAD